MDSEINKLHTFKDHVENISLPQKFTCPFYYSPHPLCRMAAEEVQKYVDSHPEWKEELGEGKMFGVLVVKTGTGITGYLAAFSGNLAKSAFHDYFVPPVYDLEKANKFYRDKDAEVERLTATICGITESTEYRETKNKLKGETEWMEKQLLAARENMQKEKARRNALRQGALSEEEKAVLVKESQFQKAEYKRLQEKLKSGLRVFQKKNDSFESQIEGLKTQRKQRSISLQKLIFDQYLFFNARGETRTLDTLFRNTLLHTPPSGAGECAGPKLLQYAYQNNLEPVAMAEFWWGGPSKEEIRIPGRYYPACKGKCGPILGWMLQGLDVERNPLEEKGEKKIRIVYEDEWLMVIDKPEGLLSVPGKMVTDSVSSQVREMRPEADGPLIVHRLDMPVSGLMLVAKSKELHRLLQKMFLKREIVKKYVAVLSGIVSSSQGTIELPLCPDYMNRPRQKVSFEHGKPAVTQYHILSSSENQVRVELVPLTGRTHQLRVHAASKEGLDAPILGDNLYGDEKRDRLYLHAQSLDFVHPKTGKLLHIEVPADF